MKIRFFFIILSILIVQVLFADNYSLEFDGVDDLVNCGNDVGLNVDNITVQGWVKLPDIAGGDRSWIAKAIQFHGWYFRFHANNTMTFYVETTNGDLVYNTTEVMPINQWTHLAATYDGSNAKIYINGDLASGSQVGSGYGSVVHSSYNIYLCFEDWVGGMYMPAQLDEVNIWDYALSQSEIQTYMTSNLSGNEVGLIGYWQFNEGSGTIAYDQTSNGIDGTIYGATWSTDVPAFELTTNFSADPTSGYVPLTVNFTDESIGIINNWYWDFQNDGVYDSFEQNPTLIYKDTGVYDVKLKITNEAQVDSLIKYNYITVEYVPPAPPTDVEINISGNDAVITWAAVDTTIFGTLITPNGYIVLNNENPYTDFIFLSFTPDTTYTHAYVGQYINQMFYRIVAVVNLSREEMQYLVSLNNSRDKIKWSDVKRDLKKVNIMNKIILLENTSAILYL